MKQLRAIPEIAFTQGCTCCVVLVTKTHIYCANTGDSRAILQLKNGEIIELSHDHKPDSEDEIKRIKLAGGEFDEDGRVVSKNFSLAVSRAIGDWEFK